MGIAAGVQNEGARRGKPADAPQWRVIGGRPAHGREESRLVGAGLAQKAVLAAPMRRAGRWVVVILAGAEQKRCEPGMRPRAHRRGLGRLRDHRSAQEQRNEDATTHVETPSAEIIQLVVAHDLNLFVTIGNSLAQKSSTLRRRGLHHTN